MGTFYLIANPIAGSGAGARALGAITAYLSARGERFTAQKTEYPGHATEIARDFSNRPDCERLAVIGGDGTFYESLAGVNPRVPLLLVPAGTGNDFAHAAGLISDPVAAAEAALTELPSPCDYIDVDGRRCLNCAGFGFDIDVLEGERRFRRRIKSRLSYYLSLFVSLIKLRERRATLLFDGGEPITVSVFIVSLMNGQYIGGGMPVSPDSRPDDGVLDAVVIRRFPRYLLPKILYKYLKGRVQEEKKYVTVYHCREMTCSVTPFSNAELDGEILDIMPMRARIVEGGIRLYGKGKTK